MHEDLQMGAICCDGREGTIIRFTQEGAIRLLWRLHYRVDQQLVNKLWPSVVPCRNSTHSCQIPTCSPAVQVYNPCSPEGGISHRRVNGDTLLPITASCRLPAMSMGASRHACAQEAV